MVWSFKYTIHMLCTLRASPWNAHRCIPGTLAFLGMFVLATATAQTSSNACGTLPANKFPVGATCSTISFDKPTSYTAAYNPGGCNSSNNDDAYGWFTAISTTTTITYVPSGTSNGILHILNACGGAVLGCADAAGNGGAETVTITTVPGTNYIVRVQRKNTSDAMTGTLCVYSPANCSYLLTLFNTNSSSWGSSNVTVYINGVLYGTFTRASGGTNTTVSIPIFGPGSIIRLDYDASGSNQNRNRYTLTSPCPSAVVFNSGTSPTAGTAYNQTLACPPAPAQDCQGGATVCSNQSITSNSTSSGCTTDLNATNRGCLSSNEHQGTWYYFSPSAGGTLGFTITPQGANDDYDFALWGPFDGVQCPTGPPTRCSYYDGYYYSNTITGMGNGATDVSEGPYRPPISGGLSTNNGWVRTLDVIADKVYVLYIDNYSTSGQAFTLDWDLTGGASLNCTTLPVELLSLEATAQNTVMDVTWATATEQNSDYFEVQRSGDNESFTPIGIVGAAGDAQFRTDYLFVDQAPLRGANYYRLRQVDRDGAQEFTRTVVAFMNQGGDLRPVIFPNPTTDVLNVAFNTPLDGSAVLYVQDALGRMVTQSSVIVLRGERTAVIPTVGLANGWYNLRIAMPDGTLQQGGCFLKR